MKTSNGGIRMKKPMSKTKKIIYDILFVIALAVFLFSAYKLISIYYLNYQEGKEKDAVQEVAKVPKNPEKEDFTIDWKALKEKNPEVVGWILIPDTDISYPIVQGSDNSYYLNHTFEKKENYAGAIFMDAGADASFQDRNTIIYGHNVKHGTMFAELEKFKEQAFLNSIRICISSLSSRITAAKYSVCIQRVQRVPPTGFSMRMMRTSRAMWIW